MSRLTPREAAAAWESAGGPSDRVVAWVAVAVAESSLDTDAVSPAGALGLWQIMPDNFGGAHVPLSQWRDPFSNALVAVRLSAGGMNFAPWDTAYRNINATGRYAFLNWPETGSAAWNNMPYVSASLGGTSHVAPAPPVQPGVTGTLPAALDWYAKSTYHVIPALITRTRRLNAAVSGLYTR